MSQSVVAGRFPQMMSSSNSFQVRGGSRHVLGMSNNARSKKGFIIRSEVYPIGLDDTYHGKITMNQMMKDYGTKLLSSENLTNHENRDKRHLTQQVAIMQDINLLD